MSNDYNAVSQNYVFLREELEISYCSYFILFFFFYIFLYKNWVGVSINID